MVGRLRPRPGCSYVAGPPVLVAHRGGSRLAPENTLVAFRQAVDDWGADMLEMDVHLTADGEVVVIHDADLDRTTSGSGPVASRTLAELREVDAGYHFVDLDGKTSFRGRGATISSIGEVIEAFPDTWLNVELKAAAAAKPLLRAIHEHGAEHRVLVAAEHERNRVAARGYAGPWGASRRDCFLFVLAHYVPGGSFFTPSVDIFQVPEMWRGRRILTPKLIEDAHLRNIPVHVWTVDDPDDMRRLLSWGVDGIQTDRPDLLSDVLMDVAGRPAPPIVRRESRATESR